MRFSLDNPSVRRARIRCYSKDLMPFYGDDHSEEDAGGYRDVAGRLRHRDDEGEGRGGVEDVEGVDQVGQDDQQVGTAQHRQQHVEHVPHVPKHGQ